MDVLNQYIDIQNDLAGGAPVLKGTRVSIKTLFDYLEEESLDDFLKGFPSVSKEQAEGVIETAANQFLSQLCK